MSWKDYEKAAEKGPFSFGAKMILLAVGLVLFAGAIFFVINPAIQGARIVSKTLDADNVIHNYEFFKRQHEDFLAIDKKFQQAKTSAETFKADLSDDRKEWHRTDREEYQRLRSIADGLGYQREDIVAEYNAKSKMANRSIFKDNNLPDTLQ